MRLSLSASSGLDELWIGLDNPYVSCCSGASGCDRSLYYLDGSRFEWHGDWLDWDVMADYCMDCFRAKRSWGQVANDYYCSARLPSLCQITCRQKGDSE